MSAAAKIALNPYYDDDDDDDDDDGKGSAVGGQPPEVSADPNKLSEKEEKKLKLRFQRWRTFIDFLLRHVAVVTYRYNCFERDDMLQFMMALEKAESLRAQMKLKKKEEPRISSLRLMSDSSDMLIRAEFVTEGNRVRKYLDIVARMRGLGTVALGFYKVLKKAGVSDVESVKECVDNWKGMCVRSYDYTQLQATSLAGPVTFNTLERRFVAWPAALRTALNQAEKYLKRACKLTGLSLLTEDRLSLMKHLQPAEMIVATRIEHLLLESGDMDSDESPQKALHKIIQGKENGKRPGGGAADMWSLPSADNLDPSLLKPVYDDSLLLEIPDSLPKEKKKKGKKKTSGTSGGKSTGKKGKTKKKKK